MCRGLQQCSRREEQCNTRNRNSLPRTNPTTQVTPLVSSTTTGIQDFSRITSSVTNRTLEQRASMNRPPHMGTPPTASLLAQSATEHRGPPALAEAGPVAVLKCPPHPYSSSIVEGILCALGLPEPCRLGHGLLSASFPWPVSQGSGPPLQVKGFSRLQFLQPVPVTPSVVWSTEYPPILTQMNQRLPPPSQVTLISHLQHQSGQGTEMPPSHLPKCTLQLVSRHSISPAAQPGTQQSRVSRQAHATATSFRYAMQPPPCPAPCKCL